MGPVRDNHHNLVDSLAGTVSCDNMLHLCPDWKEAHIAPGEELWAMAAISVWALEENIVFLRDRALNILGRVYNLPDLDPNCPFGSLPRGLLGEHV